MAHWETLSLVQSQFCTAHLLLPRILRSGPGDSLLAVHFASGHGHASTASGAGRKGGGGGVFRWGGTGASQTLPSGEMALSFVIYPDLFSA